MTQLFPRDAPPRSAGVEVVLAASEPDAREVAEALRVVWGQPPGREPMRPELLQALVHTGNYVALARAGGATVGAAVAFRGADDRGQLLHSHIAGVLADRRGAGVGYALKQHQRDWAARAGLGRVTWTFDPLVARNAHFNVTKLGARLTHYYVDFYGPLDDVFNAGDETDRCLVTWAVDAPSARAAALGTTPAVDLAALRAAGAVDALLVDGRGRPALRRAAGADVRLVAVPPDPVALRRRDAGAAAAWRTAVREVLTGAFADGLQVTAVSRDGVYVLERPAP